MTSLLGSKRVQEETHGNNMLDFQRALDKFLHQNLFLNLQLAQCGVGSVGFFFFLMDKKMMW